MKIGFDARFLTHPQPGGFKTYTKGLITALTEVDAENEYVLYVDRMPDSRQGLPPCPNFSYRVVAGSTPIIGMPWREQVALVRQACVDRLDLFHAPCLTGPLRLRCPSVVTIHDMIWRFPEQFSQGPVSGKRKFLEWYYRYVPKLAAQRAAAVLTVSHAAKASIVEHLGIPADQIHVTHEAASPIYRPLHDPGELAGLRQRYGLATDFILAIGSADRRKNLSSLVQAYAQLSSTLQERYHLVIVWTHQLLASEISQQVAALGLQGRLHCLVRVSDADLVLLYNAASLFVFPSRYEGFGLPPLEAMACGAPVMAADNSSLPEITGDAGLLFNAEDVAAITAGMARVLTDPGLQQSLSQKGQLRAAQFSWAKCGLETLAVYKGICSS